TIGMMGEVVGKAAYLAVRENTDPRGVYQKHLPDLIKLMEQPGRMRRADLRSDLFLDASIADFKQLPVGRMNLDLQKGAPSKLSPDDLQELAKLGGIVVDDAQAKYEGKWTQGHGLPHLGAGYHYGAGKGNRATYTFEVKDAGKYELRGYWEGHENRSPNAVLVINRAGEKPVTLRLNQTTGSIEKAAVLGKFTFAAGTHTLVLSSDGAKGNVHADAFQLVLAE
ncbi:MAG: NADH-dependent oxidoreductase, partial [Opitutales bacterium]